MHHGGQRRVGKPRHRGAIKAHHGDILGHTQACFRQRMHRANGNQIAGRKHGIKRPLARQQYFRGVITCLFGTGCIHLQAWRHRKPRILQRRFAALITRMKLREAG